MAKKPTCKLPTPYDDDPPIEQCGTARGQTLCAGDRVMRLPVKDGKKTITFSKRGKFGTVMGAQMGRPNKGKPELAARVCFDDQTRGDIAYRFFFDEVKKVKR